MALETIATAETATLKWCCRKCRYGWPVADREITFNERRSNQADRRRGTRVERRAPRARR